MLPSDIEAHRYIGDIYEELTKALSFVEGMSLEEFLEDNRSFYAAKMAVQNAIEASIQLNSAKKNKGQFERLFPDFDYNKLRLEANLGRHDYRESSPFIFWNDLHGVLTDLRNAAEKILTAKRTK